MKPNVLLTAGLSALIVLSAAAQPAEFLPADDIRLSGYMGKRIDDCIGRRIKAQDTEHLTEPFRHREEQSRWQTEFWGKWMLGAADACRYTRDTALYRMMERSVAALLATQSADGYIGNYAPEYQLRQWDVWGRKYTLLGLLAWYDLSGDRKALRAACRAADHLMSQTGPGKTNITATGNYRGMASSSVLEPVVRLYRRTGEKRYLEFARYIVAQWETSEGPQLIGKALDGVPVAARFPRPAEWFSPENGQKAYEMMSCYIGLLELYEVTKEPLYLTAAERTAEHIADEEINVAGSGSAFECWYGGRERQTLPAYHTMETCVTVTWMQLCRKLFDLTGKTRYADELETAAFNALLASLKDDASQIAKYSPLEGYRYEGEEQCGMHINCCNANGPRGFVMLPRFACGSRGDSVFIRFYVPFEAKLALPGAGRVVLRQETDYPAADRIVVRVTPERPGVFPLSLRIPAWSLRTEAAVNGEPAGEVRPGGFLTLTRKWQAGDSVVLRLDLRGRIEERNGMQALLRGPVVLARDSRFGDGFVDECVVAQQREGYVELTPVPAPAFAWMAFTAPMAAGTNLEDGRAVRPVHFCDFASAGNHWDRSCRYRVWLPRTLNVMQSPYRPY